LQGSVRVDTGVQLTVPECVATFSSSRLTGTGRLRVFEGTFLLDSGIGAVIFDIPVELGQLSVFSADLFTGGDQVVFRNNVDVNGTFNCGSAVVTVGAPFTVAGEGDCQFGSGSSKSCRFYKAAGNLPQLVLNRGVCEVENLEAELHVSILDNVSIQSPGAVFSDLVEVIGAHVYLFKSTVKVKSTALVIVSDGGLLEIRISTLRVDPDSPPITFVSGSTLLGTFDTDPAAGSAIHDGLLNFDHTSEFNAIGGTSMFALSSALTLGN
jgi:hypothetical protein